MKNLIFIFVTGAIASLAMAPYSFVPAILLGIAILYKEVEKSQSWQKSMLLGFFFSLGYFGLSLSWIGNALLVENNPYKWAWPLAVSGLPLILSCFTALATTIHFHVKKKTPQIASLTAFIFLLSLSELARGYLFTGFPWNTYGYTWISIMPIAQIASLSNIYVLTTLTIFWGASLGFSGCCTSPKTHKIILIVITVMSLLLAYLYGDAKIKNARLSPSETQIIIVQPNIKQSEKWTNEERPKHFASLINLSRNQNGASEGDHIIVWPETAIAQDILNAPWAVNMIKEVLNTYPNNTFLITGALRNNEKGYFNSIVTFNKNAEIIDIYDKSHLVPFGEYMPLSNIVDIAPIVGFTGFQKGIKKEAIKLTNALSFVPKVCYEIIFPSNKKINASFIINVTNDAWYGNSAGPYQHLVQSQFRAIETGMPVYRAANTGISAAISPLGYIDTQKQLSTTGSIESTIYSLKINN